MKDGKRWKEVVVALLGTKLDLGEDEKEREANLDLLKEGLMLLGIGCGLTSTNSSRYVCIVLENSEAATGIFVRTLCRDGEYFKASGYKAITMKRFLQLVDMEDQFKSSGTSQITNYYLIIEPGEVGRGRFASIDVLKTNFDEALVKAKEQCSSKGKNQRIYKLVEVGEVVVRNRFVKTKT